MKAKVITETEVEISAIQISVPVRYEDEQIPNDFPLRKGDTWGAEINMDTGEIFGWPKGRFGDLDLKVCDEGVYRLVNKEGFQVAAIEGDYVPHGVVPGAYGDYIHLEIDQNGFVTNWPKRPDVSAFFKH